MIYAVARVFEILRTQDSSAYYFSDEELKGYLLSLNMESDEMKWAGIHIDVIDSESERWDDYCMNRYCAVRGKWLTDMEWLEMVHEFAETL